MTDRDTRRYLKQIDDELNRLWRLGRNAVVAWCPIHDGIEVLTVPQYLLPNLFSNHEDILVGSTLRTKRELDTIADICEIEPYRVTVPDSGNLSSTICRSLEYLTRRFSITKLAGKAVALFDIVGFSHYSPLEQVTALNSLSYSINVAYQRAIEHGLDLSLCHSTTGDGFYVWNRSNMGAANSDLFCFLMLVLADNMLGQQKGLSRTVPTLRTGFHVGDCFEYFQAESARPGTSSYVVGDVTIQLARMIEKALPNQILIGDFACEAEGGASVNAPEFLRQAQERLKLFENVTLARERVLSIRCYLTGEKRSDDSFDISRYGITDKHGYRHTVFNAKVNVHRSSGGEIFLGRLTRDLDDFAADTVISIDPGNVIALRPSA